MLVTCVHVHVKKENINDFIAATVKNHNASVKETGNFRFDFVQMTDNECKFMLYEAYVSEEAAAAHKETSHYKEWRQTVENWMAEPRKGIKYEFITPKF